MTRSAVVEQDIRCPLCDYNLRGLVEPRCPECGSRFDWDELRDPAKRLHPYLFEHHPERNVYSFLRTLTGGLRPWRFWKTLLPIQPSRPRRLVLYGLICLSVLLLVEATQFARTALAVRHQMLWQRSRSLAYYTGGNTGIVPGMTPRSFPEALRQLRLRWQIYWTGPPVIADADARAIISNYGSMQAYLDTVFPPATSARFYQYVSQSLSFRSWGWAGRETGLVFEVLLAAALWPWLTALAFQLFRATMRRTRIRPSHLLRVAIYSGDVAVWLAVALLVPTVLEVWSNLGNIVAGTGAGAWSPPGAPSWTGLMHGILFWAPLAAIAMAAVRLVFAVRLYLRFDHAIATVISVQIIVGLTLWKLHFVWNGL
jgi:hypothetical protein